MKKNELPQDKGALENFTREVCYVKNEEGKYETDLSIGWEAKKDALDQTWLNIESRIDEARVKVIEGKSSPVLYFMELRLMDFSVLGGYTGFWKWQIKRHLKPAVFAKLSDQKLKRYADAFEIDVDKLKNFKGE